MMFEQANNKEPGFNKDEHMSMLDEQSMMWKERSKLSGRHLQTAVEMDSPPFYIHTYMYMYAYVCIYICMSIIIDLIIMTGVRFPTQGSDGWCLSWGNWAALLV